MKLTKHFILIFLLLTCGLFFSHNLYSQKAKYYHKGIKMYKENQFEKAQSFFKLVINTLEKGVPYKMAKLNMNSYYYLALTQFQLKDTCKACKNLKECYDGYGYPQASKLYDSLCFLKQEVGYENSIFPESKCYLSFETNVCTRSERNQRFYIKNLKTNDGCLFSFVDNDPALEKESHKTSFDVTTIPPQKLIFFLPEEMPEFPGGDSVKRKFLVDNIKFPQNKTVTDFHGVIYVNLIIEADGSLSNINLLRGIDNSLDEEVIRVINLMPKWIPGKCCGLPVRVTCTMPISFSE